MQSAQKTAERIDQAISFLKDSTHQLKEGKLVSLDAFQENVRQICEQLATEDPQYKEMYAAKLQVLAEFLQDFETDLRARQAEVNFELMNLNAKQKALKSYETTTHSVPKSDKKDGEDGS